MIAGRYRLDEQIGAGGMAEVWRGRDEELDRTVAIKILAPGADRARFDREGRAAAALAHPNIVQVFDVGQTDGRPFIVQEYVPGGSLEERLAGGERLSGEEIQLLAEDVAAGLAHAHARGLVHRDLKPSNLLFDADGRTKIADLGIARLEGADTLTETGAIVGTAAYLSPEQALGQPATPATDVYAFGVILYRLISGRLPFESEHPLELARMHVERRPRPLVERSTLAALAMASLAKDPLDRPADGSALVSALRDGPDATAETAVLSPPPERGVTVGRGGWIALTLAALALLAAGGTALVLSLDDGSDGSDATTPSRTTTPSRPTSTTAPTETALSTVTATTTITTTPPPPTPPPPEPPPPPPPEPPPPPPPPPPSVPPPPEPPPPPPPPTEPAPPPPPPPPAAQR
jgi:serine/threonine-protein kinase